MPRNEFHSYRVTTMGTLGAFGPPPGSDDDDGMLHGAWTMGSVDGAAASEGGVTTGDEDQGHGVGIAQADPISTPSSSSSFSGAGQVIIDEAKREAQIAAAAAAKLLNLARGGPSTPTRPTTGGGGTPSTTGGGGVPGGLFGDLFGPSTDTIVIGAGILVAGVLGLVLLKRYSRDGVKSRGRRSATRFGLR